MSKEKIGQKAKKIFKEAIVCKFCGQWLNEVIDAVNDFDKY